jgi:hypothetical protein
MTAPDTREATYVVRPDVVRWSIGRLSAQRIHPFFLAYLHLRARSVELGRTFDIRPNWNSLGEYLKVPGGPPRKPYYRPLWPLETLESPRYWLNENLAGSFAPSSLRATEPRKVIETQGKSFSLRPNHAELAYQYLLYGKRVPAIAIAAFWFRDFGFVGRAEEPRSPLLIGAFMQHFRFDSGNSSQKEFNLLFFSQVARAAERPFELWAESGAGR